MHNNSLYGKFQRFELLVGLSSLVAYPMKDEVVVALRQASTSGKSCTCYHQKGRYS